MSESEIPESWAESCFGECVKFRTGFAFKSSEYTKDGVFVLRVTNISPNSTIDTQDAVFISEKDFSDKYRSFELFEGDIVIVMVGATTGKIGIIGHDILPSVLNQNMWKLSPNWDSPVSRVFLFFLLKHLQNDILTGASGSATGFIKQGEFKQRSFPLPPLGEQRRIVAKIESTFKRIEAIEKAVESAESLLTKYRESLLNKAFRGELVPQDPRDEPASKLLERIRAERAKQQDGKKKKKDELPPITEEEIPFEIPKSWEWVRLGDIVEFQNGFAFKSGEYEESGVFLLRNINIGHSEIRLTEGVFLSEKRVKDYEGFLVREGDIVISMDRPLISTGFKIARVPKSLLPALLVQRVMRLRPNTLINNDYLYSILNSGYFTKQLDPGRSLGVPHVSHKEVLPILVPLPPIAEQIRIVESCAGHYESCLGLQKSALTSGQFARLSRDSILNAAFSGRLVPQDPSEGTGHELLEKILAAKSNSDASQPVKSPPKKRKSSK